MKKARIIDIARFSLNDGPGIRTTIFLKGCPLRCAWCHNPEAISTQPQLMEESNNCVGCGMCVDVCESSAIYNENEKYHIDRERCISCGKCAEVCPANARKLAGKKYSITEIMDIVKRDITFYKQSGGGITISGGEPLMQSNFTFDLLQEAKRENIHTIVETCGYVSRDILKKVMPVTSLFLFDYKETDPNKHKNYTGQDNMLILKNLDFLCKNNANIILRCPIIPGLNDRVDHFKAIADLSLAYSQVKKVELLPYHRLGISKREQYGLENGFSGDEPLEEDKEEWLAILQNFGCSANIG